MPAHVLQKVLGGDREHSSRVTLPGMPCARGRQGGRSAAKRVADAHPRGDAQRRAEEPSQVRIVEVFRRHRCAATAVRRSPGRPGAPSDRQSRPRRRDRFRAGDTTF